MMKNANLMKIGRTTQILTSRGVFLAQIFAGLMATLLLVLNFKELGGEGSQIIYACFLTTTLVMCIIYIYIIHHRKLHRYSRAIPHLHYANHCVRDTLAEFVLSIDAGLPEYVEKNRARLESQVQNILTSISQCFSVITGHNCAVCVKELDTDGNQRTVARDIFSSASRSERDASRNERGQPISLSTASKVIVFGLQNQGRYFLCNNLPRLWRRKRYENVSFYPANEPENVCFFGLPIRTRWTLPYKSTLVVPIRYIPAKAPGAKEANPKVPIDHYWGFLCIDSAWRNCFDRRISPDLAMAFADALHILFTQFALLEQIKLEK